MKYLDKESRSTMHNRLTYMAFGFLLLIVYLIGRLFYLQGITHEFLMAKARQQMTEHIVLQSPRGTIYDVNGNPLAMSVIAKTLYADPVMIQKENTKSTEEIAHIVAPFINVREEKLASTLADTSTAFVILEHTMPHDKYQALSETLQKEKIVGFGFTDENKRVYPNKNLAAQILGTVKNDGDGGSGIEILLNNKIKGTSETVIIKHDPRGNPIQQSVFTNLIPATEKSVRLTIDANVQYYAEQALDKVMAETKAAGASVTVMDPRNGEILAMASRPTFNPEFIKTLNNEEMKVRPVQAAYEPGSTFKPIVAAAALSLGKWHLDEVYNDVGQETFNGNTIHNWNDEGNGRVTLEQILKYSINTGMTHIGNLVGAKPLMAFVQKFGFGEPTGIELAGEANGILFNPEKMSKLDTASMSIGQGISVSQLQMIRAFGAFANQGKMMKPHLIKEILNPDGSVDEEEKIEEVGNPITPEIANQITAILQKEMYDPDGGGKNAKVEGYRFAGKTGTAQKLDAIHGGYLNGQYIASFIGYGPFPNPRFVMLVVIDNPKGMYYGGQIAAPIFKQVMTQLVRYYHIPPAVAEKKENGKEPFVPPAVQRTLDGQIILPDFRGWSMREVQTWLGKAGLRFQPSGSGYGSSQWPAGGNAVDEGSPIRVEFTE